MCGDEGSVGVKMWWLVQTSTVPNYKYMPLLRAIVIQLYAYWVVCSCRLVLLGFNA